MVIMDSGIAEEEKKSRLIFDKSNQNIILFNIIFMKKIIASALFIAGSLSFSGCNDQGVAPVTGDITSGDKSPILIRQEDTSNTQMRVQDKNERVAFELSGQKFSLVIPAGYWIADYTKIMNALRIYNAPQKSSLAFFVDELQGKNLQQIKDAVIQQGDVVKPWKENGFEIEYAAKNISGNGMGTSLRTFLWADKNYVYTLQEQPKDAAQKQLSPDMKTLADSFQLGA